MLGTRKTSDFYYEAGRIKTDVNTPKVTRRKFRKLPFRMHPRVFESLGKDLVTNDIVAVIELVKNSYDAYARNVWVRLGENGSGGSYLEIEDDGQGMSEEILEDVWCTVATPFKEQHPLTKQGKGRRRVAGEKGLGRLSALRLGKGLHMLTQTKKSPCWEVRVNWDALLDADDLSESFVNYRPYGQESPFPRSGSGTILTIYDLNSDWDQNRVSDLKNNLARLISPFAQVGEFNIFFSGFEETLIEDGLEIKPYEFLANPKYKMSGNVDENGNVEAKYEFVPIKSVGRDRKKTIAMEWAEILREARNREKLKSSSSKLTSSSSKKASCGSFDFEIRAWDIAGDDTDEIAERFNLQKGEIRESD